MRVRDDVVAVYSDAAAVGLQKRAEYADSRRLAGAVRAQEAEDGAPPDREIYPFEYAKFSVGLSETFDYDCVIHKLFEYACRGKLHIFSVSQQVIKDAGRSASFK
jgi:hypothetical protein